MKIEFIKMKLKNAFVILGLLLCSNFVNAQNTLDNVGLTNTTQASVAYSLRLLSSSYTGPLVRIKVGSLFYDVYPDASTKNFSLSSKISASISTYNAVVAAASANALSTIITGTPDATVVIWYDQSGNAIHVLSSTATAKIITAGVINLINGQPTVYFNGSTSYLTSSVTVNYSVQTAATINAVVQNVASVDYISGIIATGDNGGWGLCYDPTSTIKGYWIDASGSNGANTNENTSDLKIVTGLISKTANSYIYLNGVVKGNKVAQSVSNGTADKMYIGMRGNFAARQFNGNISEVLMFAKNLTTTEQTTLEASQSIFFPPTVTITSSAAGVFCAGTNVVFTAVTSGLTSPTYQWYKNSVSISGANASTYSTTTLTNNDVINVSCASSSSIVSDNSLSLWLDASKSTSYSGSGTTWTDISGKGNHATLSSDQSYSSGDGGSIQFNGGQNFVTMPLVSNKTTDISMQTWVYIDANTKGPFFKNGYNNGYVFGSGTGGNDFELGNKATMLFAGTRWIPTTTSYGYGWKLVTMTINASGVPSLYINNTLVPGTYTGTNAGVPTNGTYLGRNYGDDDLSWPKFNSKMGAAYFYTKALTSSEITQNYNASATRFGLSSSTSIISNSITSTVNALPSANVTVNGDACINKTILTTTSGLTSYAWYKDNVVISGATSNTFTPSASGVYKVQVSSASCSNTSTTTTIYNCGRTADGRMVVIEGSTTMVSTEGAINNGKGVDERGLLLSKPWIYGTVTTRTGRTWIDRNLGASRVALSSTDTQAYGDYFEWGRPADGHEKQIVYGTASNFTNVRSTTSVPGNSKYIFPSDGSYDWLVTPDNTLWTGVNAPNNPCPTGFRIPTDAEWAAEAAVFTANNVGGSYESGYGLRLTVAGMAGGINSITAIGNYGQYLTQTAYDNGKVKYFGVISYTTWFDTNYYKITGQSCRCIKD
jgi:hypothetical protein